uniref:Piezo-type mechanosensitive ion channel component n=1 Tax=Ditylenchus dipsaci TaxID=166011 RepID=A0A915E8J2_9BILA
MDRRSDRTQFKNQLLYHLLLPFVLLIAFTLRVNLPSLGYLIFCLLIPCFISWPIARFPVHPKRYLLCICVWASLALTAQLVYNFLPKSWLGPLLKNTLLSKFRRRGIGGECGEFTTVLSQLGLNWLRGKGSIQPGFASLAPDFLVFFTSGILYMRIWLLQYDQRRNTYYKRKSNVYTEAGDYPSKVYPFSNFYMEEEVLPRSGYFYTHNFHNTLLVVGYCLAACMYPSLQSTPLFAAFIVLATLWALHKHKLQPKVWYRLRRATQVCCLVYLCSLYIYQLPSLNQKLPPQKLLPRLLGLVQYSSSHTCQRKITRVLPVETWLWPEILCPILVACLYWLVSFQLNLFAKDKWAITDSQTTNKTRVSLLSQNNELAEACVPLIKVDEVEDLKDENEVSVHSSNTVTNNTEKNVLAETLTDGIKMLGLEADVVNINWGPIEQFIRSNSYILCLLTMITWSLIYHNWSTFVFLITACLVWMHPRTQLLCQHILPLVSIYAQILLALNFLYAFPLTNVELPEPAFLRQLGVEKPRNHPPVLDLILKSLFNLVFWATLHQDNSKKANISEEERKISKISLLQVVVMKPLETDKEPEVKVEDKNQSFVRSFTKLINLLISDFWILFVLTMLLAISVQQPVAAYRVIYMGMFLAFINLFQISFPKWRKMMYTFWMVMIAYCLFLLTLLYTYQFHGIPELYAEQLGLEEDVTRSLGLERISSGKLLFRLLTPICFLIFTLIQVNYCHERLLKITQLWEDEAYGLKLRFLMSKLKIFHKQTNYLEGPLGIFSDGSRKRHSNAAHQHRRSSAYPLYPHLHLPSKERLYLMIGRLEEKCKKVFEYRQSMWNIGWRVLEIHLFKLIAFYMIYVALSEVSSLNFFLLVGAGGLICVENYADQIANFSAVLASVIVLLKMIYQMEFIKEEEIGRVCYNIDDQNTTFTLIHIALVFFLCGKTIGILFPGIERGTADEDLLHCLLYFSNYFFYRFGVEICMISTVVTIGYRIDFYSMIYAICLIVLFLMNREEKCLIWKKYLIFLFSLFVWQYFLCIGIPSYLCWVGYPWDDWDTSLIEWLYIPSFSIRPDAFKLFADFCQLMFASCQLYVFKLEQKYGPFMRLFKVESAQAVNRIAVPDFISDSRTLLDRLKHIFFMYFYWLTLAIIFIAAMGHVDVVQRGGDLPKITLQAVGCVYMSTLYKNFCWLMQLFGIACMRASINIEQEAENTLGVDPNILAECDVPHLESGIFYDGLCFAFLLVQRRVFGSEYFKHVVAELNAQRFFASRGAELITLIRKQEILEAEEKEQAVLAKVKAKMDKIKIKHDKEAEQRGEESSEQTFGDTQEDENGELKPTPVKLSVILPLNPRQPKPAEVQPNWPKVSTDLSHLRMRKLSGPNLQMPLRKMSRRVKIPSIVLEENDISEEEPWSVEDSSSDRRKSMSVQNVIAESGVKVWSFRLSVHSPSNPEAKTQTKAKADYDEATFDEDAARALSVVTGPGDSVMLSPSTVRKLSLQQMRISGEGPPSIRIEDGDEIPPLEVLAQARYSGPLADVIARPQLSEEKDEPKKTNKICQKFRNAKAYVKEFAKNLALFFFMFGQGVIESLISYMMRLSKDYRYIAYILQEEKRIHKQLMAATGMPDNNEEDRRMSREDFERHQALVEEKIVVDNKPRKSAVLREESFKKLHRSLTQKRKNAKSAPKLGKQSSDTDLAVLDKRAHSFGDLAEEDEEVQGKQEYSFKALDVKPFQVEMPDEPTYYDNVEPKTYLDKPEEQEMKQQQQPTALRAVDFSETEEQQQSQPKKSLRMEDLKHKMSSASFREEDADEHLFPFRDDLLPYDSTQPYPLCLTNLHAFASNDVVVGTLTVPKPTKRFWITIITYTEVIVVINMGLGSSHGSIFHRNILMSIGLWKNEVESDEEEISTIMDEASKSKSQEDSLASMTSQKRGSAMTLSTSSPILGKKQQRSLTVHSIAEMVSDLKMNRSQIKDRVANRVRAFFHLLLNPANRYPVDMYAPMFICDAACFLIVIFGYSSFGTEQAGGSVTSYFQENKVPGTLVAMLIIQFILMVIDRALFLRKFLSGKLFFQLLLIIFVHVWMFLLLPAATGRLFAKNFFCQLWYFIKVIYFIISAKQIRSGYPKRQLGNAITNSFSAIYMILYKVYMAIPFLFELSLLMDWMWIDTCLSLSNWVALHDIYSNISMIKCERNIEEDYPSPKGVKKRALLKYGWGGFLLFLIILSVPVECTAKLTISGYQPLFESTARLGDIRSLTVEEYNNLYYTYRTSKTALSYIADYDNLDVVIARIDGNSSSRWLISPPARNSLINSLNGSREMSIQFDWQFKRAPDENLQYGIVEDFRVVELGVGSPIRQQIIDTVLGINKTKILIPNLFPSMVEVPGEGKADHVSALLHKHLRGENLRIENAFTDVLLELEEEGGVEWWKMRMLDEVFDPLRISEPIVRDQIIFHGFVDKVFPKSFSFITGGGILGLYVSIVLVLGHYVRGMVTDSMKKMMFEELPNVDRLLQLCQDIFLVRDSGEFELEEDLFAKLVFLFRSPATLIKWTKEKQ